MPTSVSRNMPDDPMPNETAKNPAPPQQSVEAPADRLVYASKELLKGRREIFIEHNRDIYRLRVTSQGRLILTK